jgi:hypothetical protein
LGSQDEQPGRGRELFGDPGRMQGDQMSQPVKSTTGLVTCQGFLYDRALHPELFPPKARKTFGLGGKQSGWEMEVWLLDGTHILRYEHRGLCLTELVTEQERQLPRTGIVNAIAIVGEHDYEKSFKPQRVTYLTSIQIEQLSESLYLNTLDEMKSFAAEQNAITHGWESDQGPGLSILDVEGKADQVNAHSYHVLPEGFHVLRTQTIFQIDG